MRFDAPWFFFLLLIIPAVLYYRTKGKGTLRFSSTANVKKAGRSARQKLIQLPLILRVLALVILTLALARPQEGKEQVRDVGKGIAIEMVVDRSGSMGAEMEFEGGRYNRLEVVKRVFGEFVMGNGGSLPGRPNDLIGMISFAGFADTIAPLSLGHGALSQFLESLKLVKRREEDGTAIGDGIALAAARLKTAEETLQRRSKEKKSFEIKSKIIILLTDGQNNAGKRTPAEAAALAKKWGIKIYCIGVGGSEGLLRQQGIFGSFLMRAGGGVDKQTLTSLAEATGGMFRMAEDAESLRGIYREIDEMERSEIESIRYLDYKELFQPFLFLALALLAAEVALSCTVFRKIP